MSYLHENSKVNEIGQPQVSLSSTQGGVGIKKRHLGRIFFFSGESATYLLVLRNQAHYLYMVIMTSLPGMFPSPTNRPRKPNSLEFAQD